MKNVLLTLVLVFTAACGATVPTSKTKAVEAYPWSELCLTMESSGPISLADGGGELSLAGSCVSKDVMKTYLNTLAVEVSLVAIKCATRTPGPPQLKLAAAIVGAGVVVGKVWLEQSSCTADPSEVEVKVIHERLCATFGENGQDICTNFNMRAQVETFKIPFRQMTLGKIFNLGSLEIHGWSGDIINPRSTTGFVTKRSSVYEKYMVDSIFRQRIYGFKYQIEVTYGRDLAFTTVNTYFVSKIRFVVVSADFGAVRSAENLPASAGVRVSLVPIVDTDTISIDPSATLHLEWYVPGATSVVDDFVVLGSNGLTVSTPGSSEIQEL